MVQSLEDFVRSLEQRILSLESSIMPSSSGNQSVSSTMVSTANQVDLVGQNQNILDNARLSQKFDIAISATQTTAPNKPQFTFIADQTGDLVFSIALNYDISNTQPNYSFFIDSDALSIDNGTPNGNGYMLMPVSGGYNPIPEGTAIKFPPNSYIKIYAYNSGSTAVDGAFSVSILCDVQ